jgi:hypothetical protein
LTTPLPIAANGCAAAEKQLATRWHIDEHGASLDGRRAINLGRFDGLIWLGALRVRPNPVLVQAGVPKVRP